MIQNIEPHKFHVEFQNCSPEQGDCAIWDNPDKLTKKHHAEVKVRRN